MITKLDHLQMLDLRINAANLMDLGRQRRFPMREVDPGYLVHCLLGELFGDSAPGVFAITSDQARYWRVLAYGEHDASTLRNLADTFAEPNIHRALDWETLASKTMPVNWPSGKRLGFETRICPVVRKARSGTEVDAFLAKCWEVEANIPVDREAVYREWLTQQFNRLGGAEVCNSRVVSFQRQHLMRRRQGEARTAHLLERPDVRIQGELLITDPEEFTQLLRRGIGRHRSFGFGMLLLKPASHPC